MFNPDQPIKTYKQDLLGRKNFACSLSDTILNYESKDSIVVALYGDWGSGKSSIVNMIVEHTLNSSEKFTNNKPIIINFNPWNYSDQNQLLAQFFEEMSNVLEREDYAKNAIEVGKKLKAYANFFKPLALIPTIAPIASLIEEVLKRVGEASSSWGELKSNNLNSIKSEISELLSKETRKIIVVIDDIDRLNDVEIRQIFQLVKSLGDFPNTIYLLAFDKKVVEKALEKVQEGKGSDYLEKVVQIPFEIPHISKSDVEKILFVQLDDLIKDVPEDKFDSAYWGNIYHSGLKYFFRNIRDVTRFINLLRFGFGILRNEVNVIDFLAITAIEVFEPEIYYGIRDNDDIFVGVFRDSMFSSRRVEIEQAKQRCDEIISRRKKIDEGKLKELLKRMFPKLESIYDNLSYGSDSLSNWRRELRICSPNLFHTYFRFSVPKDEISQGECQTIMMLSSDLNLLAEALLNYNQNNRIMRLLERLEDYAEDGVPRDNIENFIRVFMDLGDFFPNEYTGMFTITAQMRLYRISRKLLNRIEIQEIRFEILRNAIAKATQSIETAAYCVSSLIYKEEEQNDLNLDQKQLEKLKKLVASKIKSWADESKLRKHEGLPYLLFRWIDFGGEKDVSKFISTTTKKDDGLINFITRFLSRTHSYGASDYVARTSPRLDIDSIEKLIQVKKIEKRLRAIASSSKFTELEEQERTALTLLLDYIEKQKKIQTQ